MNRIRMGNNMNKLASLFLFSVMVGVTGAQEFIPLWPTGQMPNSKGMVLEYRESRQRITQVANPGIYTFFPSNEENHGAGVLICPPGGYAKLTYVLAGEQFAKWLNTLGIQAYVLIHRLPTSPDLVEREKGPLQDAQRAMKIIRSHADQWALDLNRVGVMGASAGGHLAATLGTQSEDISLINDAYDQYRFAPNFMVLISPVITMGKWTHAGSRDNFLGSSPSEALLKQYSAELHVTTYTPPTFLVHAQDDPVVPPLNSILFYQAMLEHQVPGTLHIFPQGQHSIALRNNPGSANQWTILCEQWFKEIDILK